MAKTKTARDYERELKKMIKGRTGKECEAWLLPQIELTASNMVMIKRIETAISEADLTTIVSGLISVLACPIDPLIPYYDKLQRTLLAQLEALGLNYNVTPKKVTENTKQGGKEQDVLKQTLDIAMEGTRNEGDLY